MPKQLTTMKARAGMQSTYIAAYTTENGSEAVKIIRMFGSGAAPVDTIRETLARNGIYPHEIARKPDRQTLSTIIEELTCSYEVMYLQDWRKP